MSMTPQAEDFERLALRWAASPGAAKGYPNMIAAITAFPELYAKNRDALPQNDSDRAFGLTARACLILDREVTYAESDEAAQRLTDGAAKLVAEALKLDPSCWDAVRVRRYIERPSREEMSAFLSEGQQKVKASCEEASRAAGMPSAEGRWSLSVYLRPYLRWLFDLANEQLGCGRYRLALATCERLLALDAPDAVGARQVAAYCCVKLEDAPALYALMGRYPGDSNAWFMLSRCFMAYKQRRLDDASAALAEIVRLFPQAGMTLSYQDELPPGMFGHLEYADGSADELYVAVSEGAVVLDENCGDYMSPLSDWICRDPSVSQARAAEEAAQGSAQPQQSAGRAGGQAAEQAQQAAGEAGRQAAAPGRAQPGASPEAPGFDDVTYVDDLLAAMGDGPRDAAGRIPDGEPGDTPGGESSAGGDAPSQGGRPQDERGR